MRLRISQQIAIVFVIIAAMTALIAATALRTANNYNSYFQSATNAYVLDLDLYRLRGLAQDQVRIAVQNLVAASRLDGAFNDRTNNANDVFKMLYQDVGKAQPEDVTTLDKMKAAYTQFVESLQPAFQAAAKPDAAQALQLLTPYVPATLDFVNNYANYEISKNPLELFIFNIDTLLTKTDASLLRAEQQAQDAYQQVIAQVLTAGVLALVIIGILLIVFSRNLTGPLAQLLAAAESIGRGNLDQSMVLNSSVEMTQLAQAVNIMIARIKSARIEVEELAISERSVRERLEKAIGDYTMYLDKVGQRNLSTYLTLPADSDRDRVSSDLRMLGESMNRTVASLAGIASQSREIANSTASAAAEILSAVMSQVTGGNEQSRAVVELRAIIEKFRDTSRQTTEQAQGVTTTANRLQETVALGESAIEENVSSMDRVRSQTETIAASVLALSERTQAISQIISSVDDLAEQSKILALNAAIEAARAGEAGKSFAVVADEVRNLANQSRQATGRIGEMLGEIQRATNKVVMTTEEGIKQVDNAVQLVRRAGDAIEALAESVTRSSQVAQEILVATQQQMLGMGQMVEAMDNIEQVTAQSVTAGLQTERAAHNLNDMAQQLLRSVEQYQL